jgi:glutathione synthase/RimK-type ligase-like ATP-grasp enzyme
MKNILIITNTIDLTVDYLIDRYSNQINFFRFNTDRFQDYNIQITYEDTVIEYIDKSSSLRLLECDALYYRKISLPSLDDYSPQYQQMMQREMMTVIDGIAETAGDNAITRPSIMRKADNKVVQLQIAKEVGFTLPRSLITNFDYAAQKFSTTNKAIIKPISFGRIVGSDKVGFIQTNMVNNEDSINGLNCSPAYFQSYQSKDYEIRLTIVNNQLFGVRIDSSDKVDWRKENAVLQYTKISIPPSIAEKCLDMMSRLNLNFAAFDFIVSEGEYIFLELNANGQWLWLENELNLGIADAIISTLCKDGKNE